jgi:hypothetical protein
MKHLALVCTAFAMFACGGDDSSDDTTDGPPIDSAPIDGTPGIDAAVDAAGGTACTKALYDVCTGNAGCNSGNCHLFNDIGSVCTQACSGTNPCPMQGASQPTCNGMGICKPAAPNACTPQ